MATTALQKSTTVRIRLTLTRLGFGALERLAPGPGARLADRLWFTLPPPRPDLRPVVEAGTPFAVTAAGITVRGRRWGDGPVVYLVHGWGGDARQLGAFVRPLVAAGFTVVSFDGPSHGDSDPGRWGSRRSDALELGRALDAVAAEHGPAYAVVAHSMGAVSTMLALRHGWLGAERMVMVAPMVALQPLLRRFEEVAGFGPRIRARLFRRLHVRIGLAVEEFDLHRLAGDVERPELLALHDEADRSTSYAGTAELVDHWPGARLLTTHGLGHRRILRDPDVLAEVTRFVAAGRPKEGIEESA